jgi:polyhydroxybutyrate depolymerase
MRLSLAALAFCCSIAPAAAQPACGEPAGQCATQNGFYRLALPARTDDPVPAVVFLHGWGSSSKGVMKNRAMLAALSVRGYALIAPEGRPTSATR